jgi:hypothetical protein
MGTRGCIESSEKTADAEGSHTALLSILLLGLCDELGDVFDWRVVVVVEPVALAFDSRLVGQDSAVCCQTGVSHVDAIIQLHDLLNGLAILQFGHCFFLSQHSSTSTARITDEAVMSPTAQRPFLTASMAYSTWKRWPLGEKTVMAVSYI